MPDLGLEFHLRRLVGILRRQHDIDLEKSTLVAGIIRALNITFPVPVVSVEETHLHCGFFRLHKPNVTVLANSQNSFLMRISFFCISIYQLNNSKSKQTQHNALHLTVTLAHPLPSMFQGSGEYGSDEVGVGVGAVHFRSQNAILFDVANYNQMRKRDSAAHSHPPHSNNILYKLTAQNFERKDIDSSMIGTFNNFIFNFAEACLKGNPTALSPDSLKLAVELIVAFEANLAQESSRHSCTIEEVITLFANLVMFVEKIAQAWNESDKLVNSEVINVIWLLLDHCAEEVRLPPFDKKMEGLSTFIQSSEGYKGEKVNIDFLVKQSFSFVSLSPDSKNQISNLFISFLRHPNHIESFKSLIQKYLNQCLLNNHVSHFKKALIIYQHFGASLEERRTNFQALALKVLQSNYSFSFVIEINSLYSFSKLFNSQSSLKAIVKTIEKVIEKSTANAQTTRILQEISQLCLSEIEDEAFDKLQLKLESFLVRIIDWVISRSSRKEIEEVEVKEKAGMQAEQREEKLVQFAKKLSQRLGYDDNNPDSAQLQRICASFNKILKKLITNRYFRERLNNITLDSFPFLKTDRTICQTVRQFILDVVPSLLITFDLNFKDKSPLAYAVMVRRAEIQAQHLNGNSINTIQQYFNQAFFQMLHPDSLNYHFMLSFVFLKYLQDKETITEMVLEELMKDLSKDGKGKDNRNLIINMGILLRILYPISNFLPIKFKVREIIKNPDLLAQKLGVNQVFTVCSKQLGISRAYNYSVPQSCIEIQSKLCSQLPNYSKDNITLFYSLIIGISDIIQQRDSSQETRSQLLTEIKYIRRINFLTETFTLVRMFIQSVAEWRENGTLQDKKISAFLLLAKITLQVKNSQLDPLEDLDLLTATLKQYVIEINSQPSFKMLTVIDRFKTNRHEFREDKYFQSLSSKNFIKFYSESAQDQHNTHVILMRVALRLLRKAFQAKSQSFEDLQEPIKTLYLIYLFEECHPGLHFTDKHDSQLKTYLLLLLLSHKIQSKENISSVLDRLRTNLHVVKELTLPKHEVNLLSAFKAKNPFNLIELCVEAIAKIFTSFENQDAQLFRFVIALIENDKKDNCFCLGRIVKERLQTQLQQTLVSLIIQRVQIGLALDQKKKTQFLQDSSALYQLLGKALEKGQLLTLIQDIVQIDYYSQCDISAFLLKEIANIFSVVEEKNGQVCDTIFNYIITLTEIFPNQEKLQIANFICNFFGLASNPQERSLQGIEKTVFLQCNSQFNYKCLRCDDKRLLCLACSLTCHKQHPVCFLSIPPQIKISRCQCREIPNCCQFSKEIPVDNRLLISSKPKSQFPPSINHYVPSYMSGANREFIDRMKYGVPRQQADQAFSHPSRFQYNQYIQEEEYDRMDNQGIGRYDEFAPRMGSRLDRLYERDQYPPQAYRIHVDRNRPQAQNNPFLREKDRDVSKEEPGETVEPEFVDEQYEKQALKMEIEENNQGEQNTAILKKYALLPKFIDLMVNFCAKKATKDKLVSNLELWSPVYNVPNISKIMALSFRVCNASSYHLDVRRQNPLNNVSCVLIKRNLALNHKFVIIASGTDLQVYNKEKLFLVASDGKPQGFNPIHRHSVSYEVHSVQFNPTDKTSFCASGLHNLALFTLSNDGGIGRTQHRYSVNNLYINKIKLAKMGIFVGVEKEIRVLNYNCKQILTIRTQDNVALIREWSIYEKIAGCQVYFVCPNGNIFFADILPSDQGKKEFTGKVNDQRKTKSSTGASVYVKDLPDLGKMLFASFKDGYNILGRLEGDQMQSMTDLRFKGIKIDKNIFDTFFIVGHVDIIKLPQIDEVYVVCTLKKYFPPEMAFHQGFLAVIRLRKDGATDVQILNDESTCETFQVFYIGTRHFFILSLHTDGSLQLNSPTKIPKNLVDEQCRKSREMEMSLPGQMSELQPDTIDKTRKALEKQLTFDSIRTTNISSSYNFRQNAEPFKLGIDFVLLRNSEHEYELKQLTFGKVITGLSLPSFGNVELPTRSIFNTFQLGFTNSQALYFFAQGGFIFKYYKNQTEKYSRESTNLSNNRILEKMQRIERLNEYSDNQRIINASMMSNFLNIKEDSNQDIIFVARSFENFKSRISRFQQYFSIDSDQESSSIEKTALIIKMFLSKGLKQGNFCEMDCILELVEGLKSIVADVNKKLFLLLKDIIVLAIKVYEKQIGRVLNLYTEENYGLRAATESRLEHFYGLLKLDIGDDDLNEFLQLLVEIINEDLSLFAFYCAKYSGLLAQLHRRLKRADTEERASALVKIYALGFPVLCYCEISCSWILSTITQIVYAFIVNRGVRESLYEGLRLSQYLTIEPSLKGLGSRENEVEDLELLKNMEQGLIQEEVKDPMAQIYLMFNRGEIDEDAMLRMIQDATKLQYQKAQEINQKPAEDNAQVQPELQLEMEENIQEVDHQLALLYDLIEDCTESFEGDLQLVLSRIVTLYVISKAVDRHFSQLSSHLLQRICKMVAEIDLRSQGQKLAAVLSYSCLFNRVIISGKALKENGFKDNPLYRKIEKQANDKLIKIEFQQVQKIKNPLNLLPRIFRGEKPTPSTHIAYGLANLLIFPCEPSHVLLSLQCYWLLPNPRQSYSRQKSESSIRDGITSGNLARVYQIAKQNPEIWQQSGEYLQFIEQWIEAKRVDWQLALELLALFYQH